MAYGADDTDQATTPAQDPVDRILSRAPGETRATVIRDGGGDEPTLGDLDLEERYALRRVQGLSTELEDITEALPDFRYRAVDASGIVENEICPVFVARTSADPTPLDDEVCEWQWVKPAALRESVTHTPFAFSPWLVDQMGQWGPGYGFETSVR